MPKLNEKEILKKIAGLKKMVTESKKPLRESKLKRNMKELELHKYFKYEDVELLNDNDVGFMLRLDCTACSEDTMEDKVEEIEDILDDLDLNFAVEADFSNEWIDIFEY